MPNYISYRDDLYRLPDDPAKAAAAVTNIKALVGATHSQITTQITNQDSSVRQEKDKSLFKSFKEAGS